MTFLRRSLLVMALWAMGLAAAAQSLPFPAVYAITGARVEIGNGRVLTRGTVLIRDGLIEAVGPNVPVPPEAEVIKGDGLVVYPGFIDAHLTRGLKLPDPQPNADTPPDITAGASPSMREANRKGVRPELRAAAFLDLPDSLLQPVRAAGFTTALLAPSGGILNGTGCLINLSGRPPRESVVRDDVGQEVGFHVTGEEDYPGTLLGIFSQIRQTLLDAGNFRTLQAAFARGGGRRPPDDEALAALQPVLDGKRPVVFAAGGQQEILRALKLAGEFHLQPVISGGSEAWKQAPLLARRRIPVLVSLDLGEEPVAPPSPPQAPRPARTPSVPPPKGIAPPVPAEAPPPDGPGTGSASGTGAPPEAAELKPGGAAQPGEPAPKPALDEDLPPSVVQDRYRRWQERIANAAVLQRAGVLFAFSSQGLTEPSRLLPNVRHLIQAGLPRDAALAALTINAARIFGVDRQMGTVEPGKIAALVVMTGDFADPRTRTRYLFIDSEKFEPGRDPAPKPAPRDPDGQED